MSDDLQITQVHTACRNCGRDLGAVDGFQIAPQLCGDCQFLPSAGHHAIECAGTDVGQWSWCGVMKMPIGHCGLCGSPEYSGEPITHSTLCDRFRELERRVAALEARSINEEDQLP